MHKNLSKNKLNTIDNTHACNYIFSKRKLIIIVDVHACESMFFLRKET